MKYTPVYVMTPDAIGLVYHARWLQRRGIEEGAPPRSSVELGGYVSGRMRLHKKSKEYGRTLRLGNEAGPFKKLLGKQ